MFEFLKSLLTKLFILTEGGELMKIEDRSYCNFENWETHYETTMSPSSLFLGKSSDLYFVFDTNLYHTSSLFLGKSSDLYFVFVRLR